MSEPLSRRALGRWRSILPLVEIEARYLTGKHGPCPICKEGKDRFRFTDHEEKGCWICNTCGRGNGIDLVMRVLGIEFRDAAERIEGVIGRAERIAVTPKRTDASCRAAMGRLWASGQIPLSHSPPWLYMASRGLSGPFPKSIRWSPRVEMTHQAKDGSIRVPSTFHPAMLTRVLSADGTQAVGVQRTYLNADGTKVDDPEPRRLMPGPFPFGSAVRLATVGDDGRLGVAEGTETALSAAALFGLPVWATLTAENLARFVPPAGVTELVVFGDNDLSYTGQVAAYRLAQAMHTRRITVTVQIPSAPGWDWNDELRDKP